MKFYSCCDENNVRLLLEYTPLISTLLYAWFILIVEVRTTIIYVSLYFVLNLQEFDIILLVQQMLGGMCQSLLVKYGMSEASSMGSAFHGFLTTASACLLTTALLITCYVLSSKTQQLIRQSIFVSSFFYLIAKKEEVNVLGCVQPKWLNRF